MAAAASTTKNGFLEFVEVSESYTESRQWHSPRISFSNEFAQPTEEGENSTAEGSGAAAASQGSSAHNPSSSGEFEFNMAAAATQPPVKCPMLSADELFYKGKLLPLHLPPRIRMVQDLSEVEERSPALAMMRRERSLRSPARPSVVPCTLKSSSYPPPGCSSRPPSPPKAAKCSSRWRDLFGFKKGQQQQQQTAGSKPPIAAAASTASRQAAPSRLLKMIFNRGSSNSNSNCSSSSEQAGLGHHEASSSSNEALLPLLRDSSSDSSCPVAAAEMGHSSSISSTSSFSSSASSNWAASSASSSTASTSSFSAEFPEVCSTSSSSSTSNKSEVVSCRKSEKLGNNSRGGRGIGSPNRRRGVAGRVALLNKAAAVPQPGVDARVVVMKNLQRCGSNRKAASSTSSMGKMMQLQQDHVSNNHNNNNKPLSMRPHSDSWRRPEKAGGHNNGASYSSSVRVTPVLHVPACIGPSLRSVRVNGFRRLFSSSSSSSSGSSKPSTEGVVVM